MTFRCGAVAGTFRDARCRPVFQFVLFFNTVVADRGAALSGVVTWS
jgi:hypothetical protein